MIIIGCMFHVHKGGRLVNVIRNQSWQHCRIAIRTPIEPSTPQVCKMMIGHMVKWPETFIRPELIQWPKLRRCIANEGAAAEKYHEQRRKHSTRRATCAQHFPLEETKDTKELPLVEQFEEGPPRSFSSAPSCTHAIKAAAEGAFLLAPEGTVRA